jgi:nucleotide sugar dehydrogenase
MLSKASAETLQNENSERSEKSTVGIVGCERNGILHACLFAEAGFKVICADNDRALVERVSKGKVPFLKHEVEPILRRNLRNGRLTAATNLEEAAAQSSIVIVTTPAVVNEKGMVDYSNIEKALKRIGLSLRRDKIIIIVSVVGVGVTENILKEVLESVSGLKVGVDFYFAYSPAPFFKEQTLKSLEYCKRLVAAQDITSLEKASNVISFITKEPPLKTLNIKAAEAAVLFEAVCTNVGFALANEFALFCEKMGIDYFAVQSLLMSNTKIFAHPTLDCGGSHETSFILLEEAENSGVKLQVSRAALKSSEEALKHGITLVHEALKECGKTMRRAKIALLGVSQKQNMADTPKSSFRNFVKMLESKGARLSPYDPYLLRKTLADAGTTFLTKSLTEAVEGADCIVIFTGHDQFKRLNLKKLKLLAKMPAAIVDFEGVLDPEKVEAEGFIYRGLGRGVWKK